jgi:PAS domain S-box-containing protein
MAKRKPDELIREIESLKKENSELKSLLQNQKKKSNKETQSPSQDITIFRQIIDISIKLDYLPYNEIFPFITSEIKSILGLKAAFINTYDEATSELVFQYSTLSDEENSKAMKLLGGKLLKRRTYVSDKEYKRITSKIYEKIPSLHELTFGAIPDIIGKPIEKLFGVDWFGALGLIHNEKLVGTIIFAGNNNQQFPERETVSTFAEKVAHALVRKEFEEKLTESERRYQSIINSSPVGMHIYELQEDDKLVFIGANPAADKILGFDHKTIYGLTIEEAFPPLIETEVPARYREVIKNKTIWKTDQINYKDNKIIGAFEVFAYSVSDNQLVVRFDDITLRLQREQIIKESEEYLSITLNSIGDGVISTDKIGRVTKMNPVAEKLCGWNFEQAKGKLLDEVFNIVDATTKQKLSNPVEKVIKTGEVVELSNHMVLISKDGTERNISDSAAPIIDKDNNIQGVVLVFSDVTEKYKAREEIKARERRFERLIHNSFDTIVILDREGIQRYVSATAERVLGYSPEELNDIPVIDQMIHPDDKEQVLTAFRQIIETGQGGVQYRHRRKSGGWVHLEALGTNQLDNPDINGVVVNVRDITERKRFEIEIQVEKERISTILNLVGDPIFVKDDQHRFTFANKAFYEMVGLDEKNVIGKTLAEDIPLEEMNHFLAVDRLVLDTGIPDIREEELTINNTTKSIVTSKTRFTDDSENSFLIGSIRDITERVNAEKEKAHFNELMKFVIENTKSSVSVFDAEMNYIYVSDQYFDDLHLTDRNIIGRNHYDVFPYLPQYLHDIHKRSLNGETISGDEDTLIHPDGSKDWGDWTCMPWYKADKSIGGLIIYIEIITKRKIAEEALRESESQFRSLFDNAADPIFIADAESGIIVNANQAAVKLLNSPLEKIIGKHQSELHPKEIKAYGESSFQKHKAEIDEMDLANPIESIVLNSNGSEIPVEVLASKVLYQGRKCMMGIFRDIAERKKNEELIKESEKKYRLLFESNPQPMWVYDLETLAFLAVNDAAVLKYGYSKKEFLSMTIKDIRPKDDISKLLGNVSSISSGINDAGIWRHFKKDGSIIFVEITSYVIDFEGRKAELILSNDITERKKAEEALKASEELYRKLLTTVPDLIIRTDISGNITFINESAFPTLSFVPKETLLGKNILTFISEEDLPRAVKNTKLMFERPLGIKEYKLKFEDGTILDAEINGDVIYDANNNPAGMVYVVRNITERKNMEIEKQRMIEDLVIAKEKAEEMNRVKSNFFANMSHELRTPFVGITGFAELLAESLKDSEEKQMAEGILKSSARMQDTLSKILGLAKLESDSVEVLKRKVNVKELVLDLFESFRGGALLKNIAFENEINFNELIIESDDFIIKDILQNLVSNAIKCTDKGGVKIIAEVEKNNDSDFLVIKVADTGVGIPKEKLDVIWEPFRQASEGLSRNIEGTGLGLSIVKKSSDLLGGIINVVSEEGKGSLFTIRLPIKIISGSVEVGIQNTELVNPTAINKRILYVEDDELSREVVKRFLFKTSEIEAVSNASEAMEKVKSKMYDAILMDINLKGSKNGVVLTQEIRSLTNYERIPIIAITAYASQDDKVKFLSQGFTHYISKPFKKLALIELINSVFTEY